MTSCSLWRQSSKRVSCLVTSLARPYWMTILTPLCWISALASPYLMTSSAAWRRGGARGGKRGNASCKSEVCPPLKVRVRNVNLWTWQWNGRKGVALNVAPLIEKVCPCMCVFRKKIRIALTPLVVSLDGPGNLAPLWPPNAKPYLRPCTHEPTAWDQGRNRREIDDYNGIGIRRHF